MLNNQARRGKYEWARDMCGGGGVHFGTSKLFITELFEPVKVHLL